jgi:hypothetical protein
VWERLHTLLLAELRAPVSWSGCARSPTPATYKRKGGTATGPSSVDRARPGSKHHLLIDATGIPLGWTVTGGNRNDVPNSCHWWSACRRCAARSAGRAAGLSASPLIGV